MHLMSFHYTAPFEEIQKLMQEHRQYMKKYIDSDMFILYGRKLPGPEGFVISRMEDREKMEAIAMENPLVWAGLAEYELTPFLPTGWPDEIGEFLNRRIPGMGSHRYKG